MIEYSFYEEVYNFWCIVSDRCIFYLSADTGYIGVMRFIRADQIL